MRQIVGHDFGCIIPIRNEKFWKWFFFQFFFVKKNFQVFQFFWIFDSLMFRIFLKWPNLKYFIWFVHSKLSKMKKKWKIFFQKKTEKKFFFCIFWIFHFWLDLCTQNHDQKIVSCHIIMIKQKKSMWNAYPLHT